MVQEIVGELSNFNYLFYITYLSLIVIIGLIVFFIRKSKHNWKQISNAFGISAIISLIMGFVFYFVGNSIGMFDVICKVCAVGTKCNCPTSFEFFMGIYFPWITIVLFLLLTFVYYLVVYFKNRK